MGRRRQTSSDFAESVDRRPALTPESREQQIVSAAYDLAEKQIREGTASAMVITHFLKLGSPRDKLERELMETRAQLARAKTDAIEQEKNRDEKYAQVIRAMRRYQGFGEESDDYAEDVY